MSRKAENRHDAASTESDNYDEYGLIHAE